MTVVSTFGDGDKSGADATVYSKDGDGNAHVTTPLSIGKGLSTGDGSIASGNVNGEGASIQSEGTGSIASGYAYGEGAIIQSTGAGSIASGHASDGASIQSEGAGSIASGNADGEGAIIKANSDGAMASGYADTTNGNVEASGLASQAFGIGAKATQDAQMVVGKCNVVDADGDYALIVGNGADNEHRSNAFAIDRNGNLVLFNAGTPVVLTPAKLATLIA